MEFWLVRASVVPKNSFNPPIPHHLGLLRHWFGGSVSSKISPTLPISGTCERRAIPGNNGIQEPTKLDELIVRYFKAAQMCAEARRPTI